MQGHYHLAGVAGVGMSALAEVLRGLGAEVTGSDRHRDQGRQLDVMDRLAAQGIRFLPQDGSAVRPDTRALVVSTAVEADNPDLAAARRLNVPVRHRSEMLAEAVAGRPLLAVAGTCGKTTVTGMLGWVLECLGADPSVANGGALVDWMSSGRTGSVRLGAGPWVIEADESDRSFLRYSPDWAIVTNISKDHFELDEAVQLFRDFAARVRCGIVAGAGAADVLQDVVPPGRLVRLPEGLAARPTAEGVEFEYEGTVYRLPMVGRHNAENACAVAALCRRLGHPAAAIAGALARFRGVVRRLEHVGTAGGVTVLDDYAHNPEKIRAAWTAAAERAARVLGVWRPHGFGPLKLMMSELTAMFAETLRPQDRLYVLPAYYAGGTAAGSVNADVLVAGIRASGAEARWVENYDRLEAELLAEARAGDLLLVMGARDPELPLAARRLVRGLAARGAVARA